MKLAISNLGWDMIQNEAVYNMMQEKGFQGLEIAPGLVFPGGISCTDHGVIQKWRADMEHLYGFQIASMQSIWFGRTEQVFGSVTERESLLAYTKRLILMAELLGCKNLVFGCPRNRSIPEGISPDVVFPFYRELGDYAAAHHTVFAMEAVSASYGTNYMNHTAEALKLVEQIDSEGFQLNLDLGTMISNGETVDVLDKKAAMINHVHISEPGMAVIERRVSNRPGTSAGLHSELARFLKEQNYNGYISIEMGKTQDLHLLAETMDYIREVFG